MRRNRLREMLKTDRMLFGAFLTFPEPRLVEYVGLLGFDWVCIYAEHTGLAPERCYELVRAADAVNIGSIIQVPGRQPEMLAEYAETGVDAIIGAHVTSAADAKAFVSALQFPPRGTRGTGIGRAANYGITQSQGDYMSSPEAPPIAAALLEDLSAYDQLEEILSVPGVELFCLGPEDLAVSMGKPGETDSPEVAARLEDAAERLRAAGKWFELSAATPEGARKAMGMGARLTGVNMGELLVSASRTWLNDVAA